jgi:type I restriction enzyme S subunit
LSAEWQSRKLSDLAQDITVGFVGSMSHLFLDSGVPLLRGQNIKPYRLDLTNLKYISTETHHKWKKSALKSGDVVIVRVGEPGTACVIPENIGELNAASLVIVRPEPSKLDSNYLCYVLNSTWGKSQISGRLVGSVQSVFNIGTATDMKIPYPYLAEQRAIAHILGTLDDKIELNRKMNETLEAMARALFKSWFVDFDPVRKKQAGEPTGLPPEIDALFPSEFEDSALGKIPKGWRVAPLSEIADYRNGLALQKFRPKDELNKLPAIKIAQLRTGEPDSGEWATASLDPSCIIENGDVIFSWSGSLTVVVWCGGKGALNQHLFKVTSDKYPKWFYLEWTLHHLPEFQQIASDKATTMGHIQRHHLDRALCKVPPAELMFAVSKTFEPWLERRISSELESRKLRLLRDTLLPKLISGELRVSGSLMARING